MMFEELMTCKIDELYEKAEKTAALIVLGREDLEEGLSEADQTVEAESVEVEAVENNAYDAEKEDVSSGSVVKKHHSL